MKGQTRAAGEVSAAPDESNLLPTSTSQYAMTHPSKSSKKKMSSTYSHLSRSVVEQEDDRHYCPLNHGKRGSEAGGKSVRRDQGKGVVGGEEEYGELDCKDRGWEKSGAGERVKTLDRSVGEKHAGNKLRGQEAFQDYDTVIINAYLYRTFLTCYYLTVCCDPS